MIRPIAIATLAATALLAQERMPDPRLTNAATALQEIMNSPDRGVPHDLLDKSQCIVVVPNLLKGAFLVGGKYGRGFASCRYGNGWSSPAGVRIEGGGFGFQLGGSSTDLFMLVMNRRGVERLLGDKFTIGGEAAASAGPVGRQTTAQTDVAMHAEILSWSRSRGLFAGISLEGATLRPDASENRKLYGRKIGNRQILETGVPTPEGAFGFMAELNRISGPRPLYAHHPAGPSAVALGEPGGRVVLAESEVHFATGQYAVPEDAGAALADAANTLKNNPSWKVRLEGFTDNMGGRESNRRLSERRAGAVMNWLANHGVNRDQMTARGYGESRPIADNSTADGRAQNRRVEILRIGAAEPTGY